jgi:hypothetical protein
MKKATIDISIFCCVQKEAQYQGIDDPLALLKQMLEEEVKPQD